MGHHARPARSHCPPHRSRRRQPLAQKLQIDHKGLTTGCILPRNDCQQGAHQPGDIISESTADSVGICTRSGTPQSPARKPAETRALPQPLRHGDAGGRLRLIVSAAWRLSNSGGVAAAAPCRIAEHRYITAAAPALRGPHITGEQSGNRSVSIVPAASKVRMPLVVLFAGVPRGRSEFQSASVGECRPNPLDICPITHLCPFFAGSIQWEVPGTRALQPGELAKNALTNRIHIDDLNTTR